MICVERVLCKPTDRSYEGLIKAPYEGRLFGLRGEPPSGSFSRGVYA